MDATIFNNLSQWYLNIWRYLSQYFDDSRWQQTATDQPDSRQTYDKISVRYHELGKVLEPALRVQLEDDFRRFERLALEPNPKNDEWRRQVLSMRHEAQDLGLRYAQLALSVTE